MCTAVNALYVYLYVGAFGRKKFQVASNENGNSISAIFRVSQFFRPSLFEQFQKLVAFLLPIFGNVDGYGSWHATSKLL